MRQANQAPVEQVFDTYRTNGDPRAFREVFDRTVASVTRAGHELQLDPAEIDDLVQDTYLALLLQADHFDPTRSLEAWLRTVMYRKAIDVRRDQARRRSLINKLPSQAVHEPIRAAEAAELRVALERTVGELPPTYAEILRLYLLGQISPVEIARRTGRTASTVRTQIARGIDRLRARLPAGLTLSAFGVFSLAPPQIDAGSLDDAALAPKHTTARGTLRSQLTVGAGLCVVAMSIALAVQSGRGADAPIAPAATIDRAARDAPMQATSLAPRAAMEEPVETENAAGTSSVVRLRVLEKGSRRHVPHLAFGIQPVASRLAPSVIGNFQHFRPVVTDQDGYADLRGIRHGAWRARLGGGAGSGVLHFDDQQTVEIEVEHVAIIRGRVVDIDGIPIDGAEVWLCDSFGAGTYPAIHAATTSANGSFHIARAGKHRKSVWARAPGRGTSLVQKGFLRAGAHVVQLKLVPASSVVEGRVFCPQGEPADRVLVGVYPTAPHQGRRPPQFAWTDRRGAFRFDTIARGTHAVATLDHGLRSCLRVLHVHGSSVGVDLILRSGSELRGRLLDASGEPIEACLLAVPHEASHIRARPPLAWRMAMTNPKGSFALPSVPGGPTLLTVMDSTTGAILHRHTLELPATGVVTRDLRLRESHPADEILSRLIAEVRWLRPSPPRDAETGIVSGRVLLPAPAGVPQRSIRLAPLRVAGVPKRHGKVLADDGYFRFQNVDPGRYRLLVTVAKRNIVLHAREIEVGPNGSQGLEIGK
ncbi:MAG: sigma-70 family RNA polymerase sigma factor [Planctomycetota bacterium]